MCVGNPKIHSFNGCLMLAIMLSIILYSEFSTLALIFSVSPHSNYLDMYLGKSMPFKLAYFLVYFLHFYFAAYIFRNFMTQCFQKQVQSSKQQVVDVEETSNQTVVKTAKNEAFRVQNNQLVK